MQPTMRHRHGVTFPNHTRDHLFRPRHPTRSDSCQSKGVALPTTNVTTRGLTRHEFGQLFTDGRDRSDLTGRVPAVAKRQGRQTAPGSRVAPIAFQFLRQTKPQYNKQTNEEATKRTNNEIRYSKQTVDQHQSVRKRTMIPRSMKNSPRSRSIVDALPYSRSFGLNSTKVVYSCRPTNFVENLPSSPCCWKPTGAKRRRLEHINYPTRESESDIRRNHNIPLRRCDTMQCESHVQRPSASACEKPPPWSRFFCFLPLPRLKACLLPFQVQSPNYQRIVTAVWISPPNRP